MPGVLGEEGEDVGEIAAVILVDLCGEGVDVFHQDAMGIVDFRQAGMLFFFPHQLGLQFARSQVMSGGLVFVAALQIEERREVVGRDVDALA